MLALLATVQTIRSRIAGGKNRVQLQNFALATWDESFVRADVARKARLEVDGLLIFALTTAVCFL
jgi:hypothetical protein